MQSHLEFATSGKVIAVKEDYVVFAPRETNYELSLRTSAPYAGPTNTPARALLRGQARKMWTVPSGGNFITPIQGTPRIVQGWVLAGDAQSIVVSAGANWIITLPAADSAVDLTDGALAVNKLVNIVLLPGATFELVTAEVDKRAVEDLVVRASP